jgi:phosphopantothenoylcysteine decarboxylase/phosphopantothenate--cysteine ligase
VGFALETNNAEENAIAKLKSKNLDLIVLNSLKDEGAGFKADSNKVTLISADLTQEALPLKSKKEVAQDICKKIVDLI